MRRRSGKENILGGGEERVWNAGDERVWFFGGILESLVWLE